MNKVLIELYLDYVNNYITVKRWSEDQGISEKSGKDIIEILAKEYNKYAELVGLQRTRKEI